MGEAQLTVSGRLVVQGEAEAPVTFVPFPDDALDDPQVPSLWTGILLAGDQPSELEHAVVAYGLRGIAIRDGSALTDVVTRHHGVDGIVLSGAAQASLDRVTACRNERHGVFVGDGRDLVLHAITSAGNLGDGVRGSPGSTLEIDTAWLRDNRGHGLRLEGDPAPNALVLVNVSARNNGDSGIDLELGGLLSRALAVDNGGDGVRLRDGFTVTDLTATGNAGAGLRTDAAPVRIEFARLAVNEGEGLVVTGGAQVEVAASDIRDNAGTGVWVYGVEGVDPSITMSGSNLVGNAEDGGASALHTATPRLRVQTGVAPPGFSDPYFPEHPLFDVEVHCNGGQNCGVGGTRCALVGVDDAPPLWEAQIQQGGTRAWVDFTGIETDQLRARSGNCNCNSAPCGFTEIDVQRVRMLESGVVDIQLSAGVLAEGRVDARGNYWGVFPQVAPVIHEMVVETVDFSDFGNRAIEGTGPRPEP